MLIYSYINQRLCPIEEKDYIDSPDRDFIFVVQDDTQNDILSEFSEYLSFSTPSMQFCKAEAQPDYISGTFSIPQKQAPDKKKRFSYCITKNKVLFVDKEDTVQHILTEIGKTKTCSHFCMGRFIFDFLEIMTVNDFRYFEQHEKRIAAMEAEVLSRDFPDFNSRMTGIRKDLLTFHSYYSQIINLIEELEENENGFFEEIDLHYLHMSAKRMERLLANSQQLREYSMQVSEVYQSQIDIKQNQIMRLFTVLTAIFMPLTLLVGWYGMNFKYMPELYWKYGYLGVGILSAIVVILCLWLFKRNKLL